MTVNNNLSSIPERALSQIIYFLPQQDRNSLALVDKTLRTAVKAFEIMCYKIFKEKTYSSEIKYIYYSFLSIMDTISIEKEKVRSFLGGGGSKSVYQIGEFEALVIPNMTLDSIEDIALRWKRMVLEEVKMSKFLLSIGLLAPTLMPTRVSYTNPNVSIPTYRTYPFKLLKDIEGIYVIDLKNSYSSTWEKGENFLFNSTEERMDEKNWESVFDIFLTDVLKICTFNLPVSGDSVNMAIAVHESDEGKTEYKVRYFGFDFSSKRSELDIPQVEKNACYKLRLDYKKAETLISDFLVEIFNLEFSTEFADENNNKSSIIQLRKKLKTRFLDLLESRSPSVVNVI